MNSPSQQSVIEQLLASGDWLTAAGRARDAAALNPDDPFGWWALAFCLHKLDRLQDALTATLYALVFLPAEPVFHFNRAVLEKSLGRAEVALAAHARTIRIAPGHVEAYADAASILMTLGQYPEADGFLAACLALRPEHIGALTNRAARLLKNASEDGALTAFRRALAVDPDAVEARHNMGSILLARGDLGAGFAAYESRMRLPGFAANYPRPAIPSAKVGGLAGQRLLVLSEQGFGDNIQFSRYLSVLAAMGTKVSWTCPPALAPLVPAGPGLTLVAPSDIRPDDFDAYCYIGSLPHLLGTTLANLPASVPYLAVPDEAKSHGLLPQCPQGRFRVGLAWQGNPKNWMEPGRSIPLALFKSLAADERLDLIVLQKQVGLEQIARVDFADRLMLPAGRSDTFIDTAAIMADLDIIISSDTAIPHLAGAMGKPGIVLLTQPAEWRWLRDRTDSPWYPTLSLVRQDRPGDWAGAIRKLPPLIDAAYRAKFGP